MRLSEVKQVPKVTQLRNAGSEVPSQSKFKVLDLDLFMLLPLLNFKAKWACLSNFGRYFTFSLAMIKLEKNQIPWAKGKRNSHRPSFEPVMSSQLLFLIHIEFSSNFRWALSIMGNSQEIINLATLWLTPQHAHTTLPGTENQHSRRKPKAMIWYALHHIKMTFPCKL